MLELLNIHFSFLCRKGRVNDKGLSPIILRLVYRMERRDIYTGLYCKKDFWDSELTRVKNSYPQAAAINRNLELIKRQALNQFDQLKFSTEPFTIDELVNKLKGKEEKPTLLIEYLKARNEEFKLRSGVDITNATYEKYERTLRYVVDFLEEEFKVKKFPLVKIDGKFLEKYFHYLRTAKKVGHNMAVKYIITFNCSLCVEKVEFPPSFAGQLPLKHNSSPCGSDYSHYLMIV